jgi:hypothetical protein
MSGARVGTVGSVLDGRIEVVTLEGRKWLVNDAVFDAGFGRVTLVCEMPGLKRYLYTSFVAS